jgi:hypothetical protein
VSETGKPLRRPFALTVKCFGIIWLKPVSGNAIVATFTFALAVCFYADFSKFLFSNKITFNILHQKTHILPTTPNSPNENAKTPNTILALFFEAFFAFLKDQKFFVEKTEKVFRGVSRKVNLCLPARLNSIQHT